MSVFAPQQGDPPSRQQMLNTQNEIRHFLGYQQSPRSAQSGNVPSTVTGPSRSQMVHIERLYTAASEDLSSFYWRTHTGSPDVGMRMTILHISF
jgi:hypothetical protein